MSTFDNILARLIWLVAFSVSFAVWYGLANLVLRFN